MAFLFLMPHSSWFDVIVMLCGLGALGACDSGAGTPPSSTTSCSWEFGIGSAVACANPPSRYRPGGATKKVDVTVQRSAFNQYLEGLQDQLRNLPAGEWERLKATWRWLRGFDLLLIVDFPGASKELRLHVRAALDVTDPNIPFTDRADVLILDHSIEVRL